jgi:hypothetical protein
MASECYREDGAKVEVEWIIRNAITSSWASGVSRSTRSGTYGRGRENDRPPLGGTELEACGR